jgi:hypothetical protein
MQRDDAVGCRDNVVCNDVKMMQGRKRRVIVKKEDGEGASSVPGVEPGHGENMEYGGVIWIRSISGHSW